MGASVRLRPLLRVAVTAKVRTGSLRRKRPQTEKKNTKKEKKKKRKETFQTKKD
jgi:hypothetical protein